jgi:hypothetical protein
MLQIASASEIAVKIMGKICGRPGLNSAPRLAAKNFLSLTFWKW